MKLPAFNDYEEKSFGGFSIQMSLNEVSYNRSIYSILDFLGDVGGLLSILLDFGRILVMIPSFLFGSLLQKFIA